jgi:hypothetical protein
MAETAQACVPMNDLDLLTDDYVSEYREKGEDSWHSGFAVYDEKRHMVDFQAICKISNPRATFVRMGNDDNFMATVNEFLRYDEHLFE